MHNRIYTILTAALTTVCAHAAVPLKWTVETSRVQPVTFEAYHGETLELEATLQSYGKPIADTLQDVRIYWQTNGMGSAYWSAPASASGNVLRATWTPAMDTGANAVYGFVGVAGENYRASFQLRFRNSPGAEPTALELPVKTIDFSKIKVLNAPWENGGGSGSTDGQAVTNIVSGMVDGQFIPTKVKADVVVDLYPETDQGYIPRSITFLSEHQILRLDADYDDGAALFGSMAEFRSKAVYRLHYVDEYCSEDIGDASILYSNGVETMTKDKRWFFLSYPEKSGTLATTDDVAEAVKDVKASAVNLEDKALGRKWELTANDGVFTFTLIEEPAK